MSDELKHTDTRQSILTPQDTADRLQRTVESNLDINYERYKRACRARNKTPLCHGAWKMAGKPTGYEGIFK